MTEWAKSPGYALIHWSMIVKILSLELFSVAFVAIPGFAWVKRVVIASNNREGVAKMR